MFISLLRGAEVVSKCHPIADLRQQLADHEADKDKLHTKMNLGDCSGLSKEARRWNSRNQGSSQLTVWQWLTRVECKLTSQTTKSKQTKKRRHRSYILNIRGRQERYRQSKCSQHFQGLSSTMMRVWLSLKRMWVWFHAHAHKNDAN